MESENVTRRTVWEDELNVQDRMQMEKVRHSPERRAQRPVIVGAVRVAVDQGQCGVMVVRFVESKAAVIRVVAKRRRGRWKGLGSLKIL